MFNPDDVDTSSKEFQDALSLMTYTNQSVFLTGKAGTGKSTFLKYLTATTRKKYVILAPTGIAAVNAGGQTIHSFFKLPFAPLTVDDPEIRSGRRLRQRFKYNKEMVDLLQAVDLIIIDEVSMVRADTIDLIDRILRVYCSDMRRPFAGKQLLLVGDIFQLEPVIKSDMRDALSFSYPSGSYFFNARAFSALELVPIELSKVFRQSNTEFIAMLDRIRTGNPSGQDIALLNAKVNPNADGTKGESFTMTIATRRDIVDAINERHMAAIERPERRFTGQLHGDFPQNSLPTDLELVLKEGAQVVFVKNDMEHRWVNGTIGRIDEFLDDGIRVELADGVKHVVDVEAWTNMKYTYNEEKKEIEEEELGSFMQYPLKPAWAITIHKSQGLTFDSVIIDIGQGAFSSGQSYVALSRCRSLEGITLRSTINARDIFVNPRIVEFSRRFNNGSLIRDALDNARADLCYRQAASLFDRGDIAGALDNFFRAVEARSELGSETVQRLIRRKLGIIDSLKREVETLRARLDDDRQRFDSLAEEYIALGRETLNGGWDADAAMRNFDKALSLSPDNVDALLGKADVYSAQSDIDGALVCLNTAIDADPDDSRPLIEAGDLLVQSGDTIGGMDYLLRALDIDGENPAVHSALANGYEAAGDDDNAKLHRRKANRLRNNPKNDKLKSD